jgi:hypothetical protein
MTTPDDTPRRFPIRFGRFLRVLLTILGAGRRSSYAELNGDSLVVRMGWAFRATIPLSSIRSTGRRGYVWWAYGVHGGMRRWIVNGSGHAIVTIAIEPDGRGYVLGVPVKLRELWVSLEDPERFRATIGR